MRFVVTIVLTIASLATGSVAATAAGRLAALPSKPGASLAPTRVEYWCSEGFAPASGGRCVATAARDEIELYVNDPALVEGVPPVTASRHHRRRKALPLHERY